MKIKSTLAVIGLVATSTLAVSVNAAPYPYGPSPYQMPYQMPYQTPYQMPYQMPYQRPAAPMYNAPAYGNYQNNAPVPMRAPSYNSMNRGPGPMANRPFPGNRMGPGPMNRSPWGGPGNRGGMPFESNFTPWSRRFWEEIGDGGSNPFKDIDEWVDMGEPREGIANMWDDMINAPHEVGQMPGGWTAPSISVPNPVDVQREFEGVAKEMPDEAKKQIENIEIQTW